MKKHGGKGKATSKGDVDADTKTGRKKIELMSNYLDVERRQLYVFISGVGVVLYAQSCSRKGKRDGLSGHINKIINQK